MAAFLFALTSGAVDGISDVANSAVLVAVRTGSAARDDS
ncbi:hypothetical protein ACVLV4_001118 [Rathayibacter agropyri]